MKHAKSFWAAVLPLQLLFLLAQSASGYSAPREPPINAFQAKFIDAYLAGTTEESDLGNGGGKTAQALAFLGREDLVMGKPFSHARRTCKPLQSNGAPIDPVSYVAQRASSFTVTMVNEAHDMPQSREFIGKVVGPLRAEGYALYGAETFSPKVGRDGPSWPLLTDGFYSQEPTYGRLIRTLRTLKFQLFSYEMREPPNQSILAEDQVNYREEAQAQNLAAQLQASPKGSKAIVHVGYGHLNKNDMPGSPVKLMAARFKKNTGVDPLTVDQTIFWSPSNQFVVCDPDAIHFADPSQIFIGEARPAFTNHRPSWRIEAGDRLVDIPASLLRPNEVAVYEVQYSNEPDDAVPVDRVLVRPGETVPLALPVGMFRVSVWTKAENWSPSIPLSVSQ